MIFIFFQLSQGFIIFRQKITVTSVAVNVLKIYENISVECNTQMNVRVVFHLCNIPTNSRNDDFRSIFS